MNFFIKNKNLKLSSKKLLLILFDIFSIIISILLGNYFIKGNFYLSSNTGIVYILISIIIFILIFLFTGQYKSITRYVGSPDLYKIFTRSVFSQFFILLVLRLTNQNLPSSKVFILSTIILVLLLGGSRFVIRDFVYLISNNDYDQKKYNVAIYGAGEAGAMLLSSLQNSKNYSVKYFFDDNKYLNGRFIKGIKIIHSDNINKYKKKIDKIFLAIPSLSLSDKKKIFDKLYKYKIEVLQIPSVEEISTGKVRVDNLRQIPIKDLLGREVIKIKSQSNYSLLGNKTILITGAGGSIGSELCNQILKSQPSRILLLDNSEPNLYSVNKNLKNNLIKTGAETEIIPILGDASDEKLIDKTFSSYEISFVFHSAAYKHVPIVEINPIQGLKNNIFSTYVICSKAIEYKVEQLVLISSDKAVRPTNIMGASKRFSELIVQAFDDEINSKIKNNRENINTKLSMVRFGNVLDSSGSVVPLFRDQISQGGPITLTHKEVIRYFMTIEEAAQLVLQATALSLGGDLFLLDMGTPVKILDLAKQMVGLSGLSIKDKENPSGDVEIITTGLRPGEKLYEELLIDAKSKPTIHPQIFRAKEKFVKPEKLWPKIEELRFLLNSYDKNKSFDIISELIPDWNRQVK